MHRLALGRFTDFIDISDEERAALDAIAGPPCDVPARGVLHRQGSEIDRVYWLGEGWVSSGVATPGGLQQIFKIHLPGDFVGVPSMAVTRAFETLTALTPVVVRPILVEDIGKLFAQQSRLAAVLFLCVQYERVMLMDRLTSIGRSRAIARLAALLLNLYDRLRSIDPAQPPTVDLPLTQSELGDLVGITAVHVNRKLQELERQGLVARQRNRVDLVDIEGLRRLADLPQYQLRRD